MLVVKIDSTNSTNPKAWELCYRRFSNRVSGALVSSDFLLFENFENIWFKGLRNLCKDYGVMLSVASVTLPEIYNRATEQTGNLKKVG